eukprot:1470748-Rhodomonas_salina.1
MPPPPHDSDGLHTSKVTTRVAKSRGAWRIRTKSRDWDEVTRSVMCGRKESHVTGSVPQKGSHVPSSVDEEAEEREREEEAGTCAPT